jgi:hypothetical protein
MGLNINLNKTKFLRAGEEFENLDIEGKLVTKCSSLK